MKTNLRALAMMAVPTLVLMVMGLAFCWLAPTNVRLYCTDSHYYFKRMVCWTVIGLALGACAYLLGWRRWLKTAPYVALGWSGLVLYSATCPLVHGHWGWIVIGPLKFDILAFAPVVVSLLASHLVRVFKCRAILIVGAALLVSVGLTVRSVVGESFRADDRFEILPSQQKMAEAAHQRTRDFMQKQYVDAVRRSRWFGRSEIDAKAIPLAVTTGMPAVATALLGRWWLVLLLSALIAQGAFAGVVGKRVVDEPRRVYVYMLGLGIVVPSLMNVAGCIGWMPVLNLGIPFASYGGSLVMATLVGMGILCSALMNETVGNKDGNAS